MKTTTFATLAAISTLTSAHFTLEYPKVRGFDEEQLGQYPCGSFNDVSSERTLWPISGGSIALEMGHITSNVEVLIAFGNNPGSAFNTILRPTFSETGLGAFCMTGFDIPAGLNVTEGMNATVQVQTNGDPDGGLYNCADITFATNVPESDKCTNGSITITAATVSGHPNGTALGEEGSSSEKPTSTSSVSGSGTATPSASVTPGAAVILNAGVGGLIMAGAAALAIVL